MELQEHDRPCWRRGTPPKRHPSTRFYSDDKGGNNKFGNWKTAGRLRYNQIRAQIKKGRAHEKTPGYKNECRLRLYKLHDMDKKLGKKKRKKGKAPKIDLSNAAVGDASDDEAFEIEEYETDDEARELLAQAQVAHIKVVIPGEAEATTGVL